jgi:hypothetical protein
MTDGQNPNVIRIIKGASESSSATGAYICGRVGSAGCVAVSDDEPVGESGGDRTRESADRELVASRWLVGRRSVRGPLGCGWHSDRRPPQAPSLLSRGKLPPLGRGAVRELVAARSTDC